jgi:5-carboxymethyl-2-hydroxymuconate isomerase
LDLIREKGEPMPHVLIEYSANITSPVEASTILADVSVVISAAAGIDVSNFKSRLVRREEFLAGGGSGGGAFVHLELVILSGKTPDVKRRIGEDCLEYLEEYFGSASKEQELQITIEIREIDSASYFKSMPGND